MYDSNCKVELRCFTSKRHRRKIQKVEWYVEKEIIKINIYI